MANTSDTSTTETTSSVTTESEESGRNANRSTTPGSEGFKNFIGTGWAERDETLPLAREQASFAAARRAKVSAAFTGQRLIVPAGDMKQRANDTDYPFRAHSAFAHLTGWGSDSEPGAVLVFEPTTDGHETTVYFRERAGRDSEEFYANPAIGEFWIGARPSLAHVAADLDLATRGLEEFDRVVDAVDTATLVLREADASVTERVDHARIRFAAEQALSTNASDAPFSLEVGGSHEPDAELARVLSELRLVKDAFEIAEMRAAIDATQRGFTEVIGELPRITAEVRGERVIEGVFATRARLDGNDVGYDSIAAAGPHATILHWTRNDGPVVPGDLVLLDAGVEMDSYYTADITRTFPVNGTFSEVQRKIYEAVREAADAAFAIVRPGIVFREVHAAAMQVIARKTAEWGSSRSRLRSRSSPRTSSTAATWCTARATTSASTCTTARRRDARCTSTACSRRAWSSRSSPACTSSPTTSPCPWSSAASACASKTTSSSRTTAPRISRPASPARPTRSRCGCAAAIGSEP